MVALVAFFWRKLYLSQLIRSLVAGPGPEAGVSRSEELVEESRRSAPSRAMQLSSSSSLLTAVSFACRCGGGIILVEMTGPEVNLSPSWVTSQEREFPTVAPTLHLPAPPSASIETFKSSPSQSPSSPSLGPDSLAKQAPDEGWSDTACPLLPRETTGLSLSPVQPSMLKAAPSGFSL